MISLFLVVILFVLMQIKLIITANIFQDKVKKIMEAHFLQYASINIISQKNLYLFDKLGLAAVSVAGSGA